MKQENNHLTELLVGSYGTEDDATLHRIQFNNLNGEMLLIDAQSGLSNPSFLAVADNGKTLLTIAENTDETAAITMLRRTDDGRYETSSVLNLPGAGPCHVAVSPDGRWAVTSNYTAGSINVVDFDAGKGSFGSPEILRFEGRGADARRQASPHAHFTTFTPDGKLMITTDLGGDKLHVLPIDKKGKPDFSAVQHIPMHPGSGPRHIAFANDGTTAYLINEIDGTVTRLTCDADSPQIEVHESIPADIEQAHGSADIRLSADGRFLYISNRLKGDHIAIFNIDAETGRLTPAGIMRTGRHPRNFIVTPDGGYLIVAARDDNRLECYPLDRASGQPGPLLSTVTIPKPVCIVPLP